MDKVGKILAQVMPSEHRIRARADQKPQNSKPQSPTQPLQANRGHAPQTRVGSANSSHGNRLFPGAQSPGSVAQDGVEPQAAISQPHNTDKLAARTADRVVPPRRRRMGVNTDLTRVKGILSKVLSYRGLDKKVERYEFILHWPAIVGERLAEVTKPECIRNRALIVKVAHPVWAQELVMMKPVILQSLARYLKPGDIVQDIVCRAGDAAEIGR